MELIEKILDSKESVYHPIHDTQLCYSRADVISSIKECSKTMAVLFNEWRMGMIDFFDEGVSYKGLDLIEAKSISDLYEHWYNNVYNK